MRRRIASSLLVALLALPGAASARTAASSDDYAWLDGFTMVELETDDVGSLHAAHAFIRAQGGNIAILSPPSLLLGWIPEDIGPSLVGHHGIRAIHRQVVAPHQVNASGPQADRMVRYFNAVASGEYHRRAVLRRMNAEPRRFTPGGDAFERDPIDEVAYLRLLSDQGFDLGALRDRGILAGKAASDPDRVLGQTDRMTGTSTVTLMFVESDGSGADADLYTWTDSDVQDYIDGVNTGLAWWSSRALQYNDCWAAFFVRWFDPLTDGRLAQWREMVLHPSSDVDNMVSDVMTNFGYVGGSHFAKVDAFNSAQCATYGTDWAYTAFVAYNPLPAFAELTDGRSAFAYLGGPYTFLLFRSFGWLPEQVFTHETGHIYYACDEYADGCTCGALCAGELNDNCEDCGGTVSCMMKANTFTLCTYTDEQVGWQDFSPCAPPALAAPAVSTSSPASGSVGTSLQLTVAGSDFLHGAFTTVGAGVQVLGTTVVSSESLMVEISIDDGATPGPRDLIVSNRDLQSSTLGGAFEVLATTRHYFSTTGGNVYPYITASDAATSLPDAISAAAPDDSILVEAGTLPMSSLAINKGVILYGGWINNFTQRDVDNNKTVLDLGSNVSILVTGGGTGGLDGFELFNGTGIFQPSPVTGNYGGAVAILSSSGYVAQCTIHTNQTNGGSFGGGGAIYADNATVYIADNDIQGNGATRGGALYLRASSGTIARNVVANNAVSESGIEPPVGAAIMLESCNNVALEDNQLTSNTGAASGGGLKIVASTGITVQGDVILNHSVTGDGGAADVDSSEVTFVDVHVEGNSAGWSSGGLRVSNASDVEFAACRFLANSAIFYGGLYVVGSNASVHHNLFANNFSGGSAGGLTLIDIASGDVTGNTFDRNSSSVGGAAMHLNDAPVEITNNIVAHSSGDGIECLNTPPTLVDWNLVVDNSGTGYVGCVPGPNAVSGPPVFADTAATDYHLGAHSAAIDAGRTDPGFEDPDGSRGDLGMFGSHSFIMEQPVFPTGLQATFQSSNLVLTWTPNPEPDVVQYAVYADSTHDFKPSAANFVAWVAAPDSSVDLGPLGSPTYYTIAAIDSTGYSSGFAAVVQSPDATDVAPGGPPSYTLRLHPNVPNPFNPITNIAFELGHAGFVRLEVYDLAGRLVRTLVREERRAGPHHVIWDGRDRRGARVSSGVYVYRLRAGGGERTRKMVLLK